MSRTIDEILFAQYQLGREHQKAPTRREVGGEITVAKQSVATMIQEIIGTNHELPRSILNDMSPKARKYVEDVTAGNELRERQRQRAIDLGISKKALDVNTSSECISGVGISLDKKESK